MRAWPSLMRSAGGVVSLVLLLVGSTAKGAERPAATSFVGAETIAFAEVRRPADLVDRATGDRLLGFLGGLPAYARALESDQYRQFFQVVDALSSSLETDPTEGLKKLVGGGILVAIEEAVPPRLVFVVTPTDDDLLARAHEKLVKLARDDAKNNGRNDPIREFDHQGFACYSVSEQEAHAIVDGRLVLASGEAALRASLDRARMGDPSVAQTAIYKQRAGAVEPSANAWAYARLDRLRALDPKRFGGDEPADPGATFLFGPWLEAARQAAWAAASMSWDEGRLAATLTLPTPEMGFEEKFKRFLPDEGQGAPAPPELPGSIASINLWRDLFGVWESRDQLLPPEALQGLAQLDGLAGTFFGASDFGAGVLEPLGPNWQIVAAAQDYDAMEPRPALKLPAFALIVELSPDHPDFAQRLRVAFQSFIGLVNLGGAETGAPPLNLGSKEFEGVNLSTASFMAAVAATKTGEAVEDEDEAEVHYRHNFTPAIAEVEGRFILSSSVGLAEQIVRVVKQPKSPTDSTLLIRVDGAALAALGDLNHERLVLQNMLSDGNDRPTAEQNIQGLLSLLRYLGKGEVRLEDEPDTARLGVEFLLGTP